MTQVSPPVTEDVRADFLFRDSLDETDPEIRELVRLEEERQARKLILIASESICPRPVREASASVFGNIYAEGYPSWRMTDPRSRPLGDHSHHLAYLRRYADGRYYKGCDYVDFVESLAIDRCRRLFATAEVPAERIFANVQPLSGAAANNAVYTAFVRPGGVVLGMKLSQGGHLTHGSPANRSGRFHRVVSYGVDPGTGRIDYESVARFCQEAKPELVIAGASAYPWTIDWARLRAICDAAPTRPILLADIAHPAGLVAAGLFPTPVGFADVVSFTTHKTLCGPRGAVLLTTDPEKAARIDAAVFPGEQGGPHMDRVAGKAVAFALAATERFRELMRRVIENARALAEGFRRRGVSLVYGGTDTHLLLVDLLTIRSPTGEPLTGEIASRILDLAGITANKNAVRDDANAAHPTAIRLGTTWVSQRGFRESEMDRLAEIVVKVLSGIHPFQYVYGQGSVGRGKVDFDLLNEARAEVEELEARGLREFEPSPESRGYPYYEIASHGSAREPAAAGGALEIHGKRCHYLLDSALTASVSRLAPGDARRAFVLERGSRYLDDVVVTRLADTAPGSRRFLVLSNGANHQRLRSWLRGLSDGYLLFDAEDVCKKVEGPAVIEDLGEVADGARRRARFTLVGPETPAAIRAALPDLAELANGRAARASFGGTEVVVVRADLATTPAYEILVRPRLARSLSEHLLAAGKGAGLTAPATDALESARRSAGFPVDPGSSRGKPGIEFARACPEAFDLDKPYFVGGDEILASLPARTDFGEWKWTPPEGVSLRRTPIFEWNRAHTRQGAIVPFAGWEMPVRYASIVEEHRAVRTAAGLFDVAHMGVLEVTGENAERFLDALTTNYVAWLEDGEGQYSYLLDPAGECLDDILVYRRAHDRFMVVVNAANAELDLAWLVAARSGEFSIDSRFPGKRPHFGAVAIRDLKDPASGADRRVDLALQGPRSLDCLARIASSEDVERVRLLERFEFVDVSLAGLGVMVSRTGYTGEPVGYELYVHPNSALELWEAILKAGEPLGVIPAGLGARDSTRMEAGFPLHGHELAGEHRVTPIEAGYEPFVLFHKPFFVGRRAMLANARERKMTIARFELTDQEARLVRAGDPMANARGRVIGHVTSSTSAGGIPYGLAHVDRRNAEPGTEIFVFRLPAGPRETAKPLAELAPGDPVVLHARGRIVPRFKRP